MSAMEEKRKFPRIERQFPIKYKDLRKTSEEFRGTMSKNISEGGIRFRSDRFISLACRLVVELNLPEVGKPIRAISKITWIKKLPVGDDFEVGNQFLEISREDKNLIQDFVNQDTEPSQ